MLRLEILKERVIAYLGEMELVPEQESILILKLFGRCFICGCCWTTRQTAMRVSIRAHVPTTVTAICWTLENGFVQCQYFNTNFVFLFLRFLVEV